MSILIDSTTRVLVQGLTGREGGFHAAQMREYGTNVVCGVTPGKGGTLVDGIPVFDTVRSAVDQTGADASVIFVPAPFAADAVMEAADAGIPLIVCITEGIPIRDSIRMVEFAGRKGVRVIGPNCPGLITPGQCKIGIMPGNIFLPGRVGIVSRSGTLTYEIVSELSIAGIGQSTCVGVGGDPVLGTRFIDVLPLFERDPETDAVVLVGEIGGSDEEIASEYICAMTKPVVGFISGRTAPEGKRMGHAGAIVSGNTGTAAAKVESLTSSGVTIAESTREIPELVRAVL